jgi:hypothetical protein
MATFNTVTTDDLVSYALWLAGEPTDGNSDFNDRVLQHMQTVMNTFVNGGTLGSKDIAAAAGLYEDLVRIPTTDWLWLRKFPPFAFVTTPAMVGSGASVVAGSGPAPFVVGTVVLTNGSPNITFLNAPAISVQGWRLLLMSQATGIAFPPITVPRIATHVAGATTAQLDTNWNQDTQTPSNFVIFQLEYPMPSDFVRFIEEPDVHGGWSGQSNPPGLAIGTPETMYRQFPLPQISQGPPSMAARLGVLNGVDTIQMNRWDVASYRTEMSYLFAPPALAVLQTPALQVPVVPLRHRHVLAIGAAMLVLQDKTNARTIELASEFREILTHMGNEHRHEQKAGSNLAGRHLFRQNQRRRSMLRTTSGLPLF